MKDNKYQQIKIKDLTLEYYVEYRNVKYTRYELIHGKLRVITQKHNQKLIKELILGKEKWLYNKLKKHNKKQEKNRKLTRNKQLSTRTLPQLKQLVNNYMEQYQKQLNVKANRIQYRQMTRKWGSCSSLQNITLSKDLKYLPEHLVAYIVYHELTHILIMAHNDKFFEIIKKEFNNYKKYDEELEQYLYLIEKLS